MLDKKMQEYLLRFFLQEVMQKCDHGTWEHSIRVGKLCEKLALELGFQKPEVSYITLAGLLHDVGKVFMPEMINYPRRLADQERFMINYHPQLGIRLININWSSLPAQVIEGISFHHERLNGSGYPYNLKGEEISIPARIVAVADVFDAMSTQRPYREALSLQEIVRELSKPGGYDPNVALALMKTIRRIRQ